ncbi:hypothetical protein T01_4176 [Trichinella spiralis]|uniref:Uncharacterized protein n=1 Tax=Trichinella spiralis TaxID=6334 RepID=A0A0V1AU20_TRISP|nr:hypothetical protein T01_4176 [Trichinella spiralis]
MDHLPYMSFIPEVSTAEDVRVWSGIPTAAYCIPPDSLIWLQSWLGAFADIYIFGQGGLNRTFFTTVLCQSLLTVSSQLVSGTIITSIG